MKTSFEGLSKNNLQQEDAAKNDGTEIVPTPQKPIENSAPSLLFQNKHKGSSFNSYKKERIERYKPLLSSLLPYWHNSSQLVDIIEEHITYLRYDTLQNCLYWYYHGKFAPEKMERIRLRAEELQDAIEHLEFIVTALNRYLPIINALEYGEQEAENLWGKMPNKYTLLFIYDLLNPDENKKLSIILEKL